MIRFLNFFIVLFVFFSCQNKPSGEKWACGYAWELLGFEDEKNAAHDSAEACLVYLDAISESRKESIIHTPSGSHFFVFHKDGYFKKLFCAISQFNPGDSILLHIPAKDFCVDFYGTVPAKKKIRDSLLRVYVKVSKILSKHDWENYSDSLRKREEEKIRKYIDSLGFYTDSSGIGSDKILRYRSFPMNMEFCVTYACRNLNGFLIDTTTDFIHSSYQELDKGIFIKGLNYVIKRISCPDTVKFILPSHMAFGEKGFYSIVFPYEPLVYHLVILPKHEK